MSGLRFAMLAAVTAFMLVLSASAGAAGPSKSAAIVTSGRVGAGTAACLAHLPGGLDADEANLSEYYKANCTGHDEPELDPVSSATGSARNITWRVQLPADGAVPVSSVGPTFWFGGTVADSNPHKLGGGGLLRVQFFLHSSPQNFAPARGIIV